MPRNWARLLIYLFIYFAFILQLHLVTFWNTFSRYMLLFFIVITHSKILFMCNWNAIVSSRFVSYIIKKGKTWEKNTHTYLDDIFLWIEQIYTIIIIECNRNDRVYHFYRFWNMHYKFSFRLCLVWLLNSVQCSLVHSYLIVGFCCKVSTIRFHSIWKLNSTLSKTWNFICTAKDIQE